MGKRGKLAPPRSPSKAAMSISSRTRWNESNSSANLPRRTLAIYFQTGSRKNNNITGLVHHQDDPEERKCWHWYYNAWITLHVAGNAIF
jgi:hypothetical protein